MAHFPPCAPRAAPAQPVSGHLEKTKSPLGAFPFETPEGSSAKHLTADPGTTPEVGVDTTAGPLSQPALRGRLFYGSPIRA